MVSTLYHHLRYSITHFETSLKLGTEQYQIGTLLHQMVKYQCLTIPNLVLYKIQLLLYCTKWSKIGTIQYQTVLFCTEWHCTVMYQRYYFVPNGTVLYQMVLYCTKWLIFYSPTFGILQPHIFGIVLYQMVLYKMANILLS